MAKQLEINIEGSLCVSKEQDTLSCITQAFKGEHFVHQFSINKYRIDLYFPFHKLAIECDEFNHKDRDIAYEVKRQKDIEKSLGCIFIRYNPDSKEFNIFEVINRIFKHIKKNIEQVS